MRTFSHAIIAAAVGKRPATRASLLAFVTGSIVPDVPLMVLTVLSMLSSPSWAEGMQKMHTTYETDTFWIAMHNTPHSLVVMGVLGLLAVMFVKKRWGRWLLWFAAGALLHTVIDIFTHATDGPMFLYPLSQLRFESPVSYWDPAYFGRAFSMFEYGLDVILLGYLGLCFWRSRKRQERRTLEA